MAERKIQFKIEALGTDEVSGQINRLEKELLDLSKKRQQAKKDAKEGRISEDQLAKSLANLKVQQQQVSKAQSDLRKNFINGKKAAGELKGSYNSLVAETNLLRQRLKDLPNGFSATNKEAAKLKNQIKQNTDRLKEFDSSIGDNFRNVGNYKEAISSAFASTGLFSRELGILSQGLNVATSAAGKSTGAMRVLKVAIAGTGIGLLVLAIGSLIAAFKSSEEGQNKFAKLMDVIGVVVGNVSDILANIGETIIDAFTKPQETINKFTNLFKQNIQNRFEGFLELVPKLGEAIGKLFSGDFSGAAKTAGDAVAKVTLGVENFTDKAVNGLNRAVEATKSFIDETDKEVSAAQRVADLRAATDKLERQQIVRRSKLEAQIADLRLKARKEDEFSFKQRKEFLQEANNLSNVLLDTDVEIAKNRAEIIKQQNSFSKSTKENLDAEAQAVAEVNRVETARLNSQRQLQREINTLNNQVAAEEKARIKEITKAEEEAALASIEITRIKYENNLTVINESLIKERDLLLKNDKLTAEQRELINLQFNKKIAENNKKAAAQQIQAEAQLAQARIGIAKGVADTFSAFAKEGTVAAKVAFGIQKGLALAEVAVGLQRELALINANPLVNADLTQTTRTLLTVSAIARGAGIIASIKNAKFAKGGLVEGGMFQGPSHANGGIKFAAGGRIMEAEGGEAIINKRSTAMFKPILSAINTAGGGKKFANGGMIDNNKLASIAATSSPTLASSFAASAPSGPGFEAISEALGNIKVTNVVTDTQDGINQVNNIQNEATI